MNTHFAVSKLALAAALSALSVVAVAAPTRAVAAPATSAKASTVVFELKTGMVDGKMVYLDSKGTANPTLKVRQGDIVELRLSSGEGAQHDFVSDALGVKSSAFQGGKSAVVKFRADKAGTFTYYCSVPGHRQIGMEGKIEVAAVAGFVSSAPAGARSEGVKASKPAVAVAAEPAIDFTVLPSVAMDPTSVPAAIGPRAPKTVKVEMETVEMKGRLADGQSFEYWTFNRKVPGPMLRVRKGDTVELTLTNAAESKQVHSVDLHAVTGPGGAAEHLQVAPGATKTVTWKALNPGLYVYHCATPMVPHHISAGMYGMILVEPEAGLPSVDREFYVMQGDIYTKQAFGEHGHHDFSVPKMLDEQPDYYVFNGAVGALSKDMPLKAKVGETVRIYFGVGGPNKVSSFHVIGEIFDKVYNLGSLENPMTNVQTVLVPAGGATIVEFKVDYPGNYVLVDHSLSRVARGLVGILQVEGPADDTLYKPHGEGHGH